MTIKQKQCLLCYLGYYSGQIDGIWGPRSKRAQERFSAEHGTEADLLEVICREETEDWWEDIQYFARGEFACKCGKFCDGYPAEMDKKLIQIADRMRKDFGSPVIVSSGLRCRKHNANVGGVSNSRHLTGKAMDFCIPGKKAAAVLDYVQRQPDIRYAYAIDADYVHMDVV